MDVCCNGYTAKQGVEHTNYESNDTMIGALYSAPTGNWTLDMWNIALPDREH